MYKFDENGARIGMNLEDIMGDAEIEKLKNNILNMVLKVWNNRPTLKPFLLTHENPDVFIASFWQSEQRCYVCYLVYRWIITLFLLICWLLSVIDEKNLDQSQAFRLKWMIYLTNWGFTVCTLQGLLCSLMLTERFISVRRRGDISINDWTNKAYKFYWACFTIALDSAFVITIMYWAVIYDGKIMPLDYLNVMVHGLNSLCMFIEFWVVGHPIKLGHIYMPVLFALAYTIFTIIYFFAGGTSRNGFSYIYKVTDWNKPTMSTAVCIGAMLLLCGIHVFFYLLHRLKVFLKNKFPTSPDKTQIAISEICTENGQKNDHFV